MKEKKILTNSEAQVLRVLWNLDTEMVYTGDVLKGFEDPKPAYTTVATFLKILTRKGFLKSRKVGSMLLFSPVISRDEYVKTLLDHLRDSYFDGDSKALKSFVNEKM